MKQELRVKKLLSSFLNKVLIPKLSEYKNSKEVINSIETYVNSKYVKFLHIDTLAFPNKQTQLDRIYEPLTLSRDIHENNQENLKINSHANIKNFLLKHLRIIIEDTAGMGKSTLSKKIFRLFIEKGIGVPILIELRHINEKNDIFNEISRQISSTEFSFNEDAIIRLIELDNFLFIFDGYDEISNIDRSFTTKNLRNFIDNSLNSFFIITSRPESSLSSFGDFMKFYIKPLNIKESYSLIKKYDFYSYKPIANALIKKLEDDNEKSIKEYLENPLLVSLIYKAFDYRKDIPLKKSQFYRQIFEALFEQHDLSKEGYYKRDKYSKLHIDEFDRILRNLGYFTFIQNKVEYESNQLLNTIEKIRLNNQDVTFNASDFIKDILETVPLFKREGNYIKWSHKSLQDYFAAKFIWLDAKHNQESILKKIYNNPDKDRFTNVFDLFYELDPQVSDETLTYWRLKDFREYAEKCIILMNNIPSHLLKARVSRSFYVSMKLIKVSKSNFKKENLDLYSNASGLFEQLEQDRLFTIETYLSNSNFVILVNFGLAFEEFEFMRLISKYQPSLFNEDNHLVRKDVNVDSLEVLEFNKIYSLDFEKENSLNDIGIFETITNIVVDFYGFNYDKAMKRLEEIQIRKDKDYSIDLLNW